MSLNKEHWSISIFAQFEMKASMKETKTAMRQAWKTIRYDHPQLACIAYGDTKIYKVPDDAALDAWLDETFIVHPDSMTKEQLFATLHPSALATLHLLPNTSEIMIHTSHWRIDFIGGLSLLQNFFIAMAEPRQVHFGDEGRNLSPCRDEAAGYNSFYNSGSQALIEERKTAASDLVMQLLNNLPSIGLPVQNPNATPGSTKRSKSVLEPETTSAIISACKNRDLTVTTALHAALIVALQQITPTPPSSSTKYTSWGIFNVRPLLKAPFNDSTIHPATVNIIGLPLSLHPSTYTDLALQLKHFYKQRLPPSADSRIEGEIIVPYSNTIADIAGQPLPENLPAPSEPVLSSVGVIDDYLKPRYGDIVVKDFWLGLEMVTQQLAIHVWTWQGRMTLSAVYNEAFYEEAFVKGFLEQVMGILLAELAVRVP